MSSRRRIAGVALLGVLAAGCGSTVQVSGSAVTGGEAGGGVTTSPDGLTVLPGTDGGGTVLGGGTGGTTGSVPTVGSPVNPVSGPGQASGPSSGPTRPASTVTAPVGGGPETGRGFTKTTIAIGVGTANDSNAFAGSFGIKGVGYTGDPNNWLKAVTDDLNKRGGLLGRKVVLVKHDYNTAQLLSDPASANQAACTTWTQDTPVFAVLLAGLYVEDTLLSCLGKVGTPLVFPGASLDYPLHYAPSYKRFPLFFNLAQMEGGRYDRLSIGRLVARGFFTPWNTTSGKPGTAAANPVKVGLIGFDDNDGAVQQRSRKTELGRQGLKADSEIACPRALTAKIQCEQSAVLRFASNGITHVFGADTIFMNNAQQQGYHPRYFLNVSAAAFAANEGANQLNGAMGEGYVPYYDVETSEYPGDPSTLALQMSICEEFNVTAAAVSAAGSLGSAAFRAGMESLGASQPSTLTWKTFLGPDQHANAAALRDLSYRSDLGRFVYADRTDHTA